MSASVVVGIPADTSGTDGILDTINLLKTVRQIGGAAPVLGLPDTTDQKTVELLSALAGHTVFTTGTLGACWNAALAYALTQPEAMLVLLDGRCSITANEITALAACSLDLPPDLWTAKGEDDEIYLEAFGVDPVLFNEQFGGFDARYTGALAVRCDTVVRLWAGGCNVTVLDGIHPQATRPPLRCTTNDYVHFREMWGELPSMEAVALGRMVERLTAQAS